MKKIVGVVLSSALIMNATAFAFSDLTQNHWAYNNVMNMYERGVVSGFNDNTFKPDDALTRVQFITMAVKSLEIEDNSFEMQFNDLTNHWGAEYIKIAGYAMCDNEDAFRPDEEALREDVAMAIVKLNKLENAEYSLSTLDNFSDKESISESRKKYVAIAVENGYMNGNADGTFSPKKALSRAEGATVLLKMLDKKVENPVLGENIVNWDGEYISNVDGLVKIKLTKVSDTEVNFYIKGSKNGNIFATNNNAVINGNTAKYESEIFDERKEMNFKFENSNLVIETSGDEDLAVFDGIYKIDDGTISTIETTMQRNPLEGSYLLGEELKEEPVLNTFEELEQFLANLPLTLGLEISNITDTSAGFTLGGYGNGEMIAIMGSLEMVDGKWKYLDHEEYTLEIELKEEEAIVTGLTEDMKKVSGTYIKKAYNPEEEYKKLDEQLNSTEISEGGFLY